MSFSSKKEVRFVTPENSNGDKGISTLSKKRYQILPLAEFEESVAGRRKVSGMSEECRRNLRVRSV